MPDVGFVLEKDAPNTDVNRKLLVFFCVKVNGVQFPFSFILIKLLYLLDTKHFNEKNGEKFPEDVENVQEIRNDERIT